MGVVSMRSLSWTDNAVRAGAAGLVMALLAVLVVAVGAPAAHADPGADTLAARIDDERAAHGVAPLAHVQDLRAVAQRRAQALAGAGALSHDPPVGTQVADWSRVTENVGRAPDLEALHLALMASPSHRANILDPAVTQVGVGVVWDGVRVWVSQVFRAPTGAAVAADRVPPPFVAPAVCADAPAAGFSDVRAGAWYADAVDCAVALGLVQGTSQDGYQPGSAVTRGQVASLLHRVVLRSTSASEAAAAPDAFADDAGSPHEGALDALAALGVLHGTAPRESSLHTHVTRAQAAALVVRLHERLASPLPTSGVRFVDALAGTHTEAIDRAVTAGIVTGATSATFTPDVAVRRDLAAVLVVRTYAGLHAAGALG